MPDFNNAQIRTLGYYFGEDNVEKLMNDFSKPMSVYRDFFDKEIEEYTISMSFLLSEYEETLLDFHELARELESNGQITFTDSETINDDCIRLNTIIKNVSVSKETSSLLAGCETKGKVNYHHKTTLLPITLVDVYLNQDQLMLEEPDNSLLVKLRLFGFNNKKRRSPVTELFFKPYEVTVDKLFSYFKELTEKNKHRFKRSLARETLIMGCLTKEINNHLTSD